MGEFIPTEYDKLWLKRTLGLIVDGGIWVTSWATYKKIDDKTLVVDCRNGMIESAMVEENIRRVKIVCESIGIKFLDPIEKKHYKSSKNEG
jgi:hypothetical protein